MRRIGRLVGGLVHLGGRWLLLAGGLALTLAVWFLLQSLSPDIVVPDDFDPGRLPDDPDEVQEILEEALGSSLDGTADVLADLLVMGLVTGVASLALVQLFKYLTSWRGWFHRREIARYLRGDPDAKVTSRSGADALGQLEDALGAAAFGAYRSDRFEESRRRRDLRYFYNLPLERLAGQISSAAELALARPQRNGDLLRKLAGSIAEGEVETLEKNAHVREETLGPEVFEARAFVGHRIQRGIDAMQIIIGHRWRWFVRILAFSLCLPIALIATEYGGTRGSTRFFGVLGAAVLGGLVAWFLRDVAAAVERRRS